MRIQKHEGGYTMWLSARDTYEWAHKAGAAWPCSTLSDKRCMVVVDGTGLCDFTVNGRDNYGTGGAELDAIVSDHLPEDMRQFWPTWK
jgi:hypothetical protein